MFENSVQSISFPDQDLLTDEEVEIIDDTDQETDLEGMWRVLIHNDPITTFEFVIRILQTIFGRNSMQAEQIAMRTHVHGIGYVGSYGKSDAEKRVAKARFAAQIEGFPLQITTEAE